MRDTHHATVARSDVTHVANATVPQIQISAIFRTVLSSDAIRLRAMLCGGRRGDHKVQNENVTCAGWLGC